MTDPYLKKDKEQLMMSIEADKKILAIRNQKMERIKNVMNKYANQKLISLTFDDGPNPNTTPLLLKILNDEGVPATFFASGERAEKYPEIVKQDSDFGNEIASHTWDHKDLITLSAIDQKKEIESANQIINKITSKFVNLFRLSYGSYNDSVLKQTSLTVVNWSIDANGWRYNISEPVIKNTLSYAHDGAIILMHDIHQWSVNAIP